MSKDMKGAVSLSTLVGWGITITIASIGGFAAMAQSMNQSVASVKDSYTIAHTAILQRTSVLETKGSQYEKDINNINAKLDVLLLRFGVNPNTIRQ